MKKKILFILIIISLFVVKVNAAGTFTNPDKSLEDEVTFNLSIDDMNRYTINGEDPDENNIIYYYAYEITNPKVQYVGLDVRIPALADDEEVQVATGISLPATDLLDEDFYLITDDDAMLGEMSDWISIGDAMEPGRYYLIIAVLVPDTSTADYTFDVSYFFGEDVYKWEVEPNNTEALAFNPDLDKMYSSYTDSTDWVDVYAANLTAGNKARIYLDNIEYYGFEDYGDAFELYLCTDANGTCSSIIFDDLSRDDSRGQYYYEFIPQRTGTYYIKFENLLDRDMYYEIGIYQVGTTANVGLTDIDYYVANYTYEDELPVYRLYNRFNGEHLYTTDANEAKVLYKDHQWGYEGIGWYTATEGTPIYRLYNPGLGNHLYTSDANEINELTTKHGWVKDNNGQPVMYSTGDEDDVPIYRVYNEAMSGMHHLTTDENEYDALPKYGWQQEGISMYASWRGAPVTTEYYNVNF